METLALIFGLIIQIAKIAVAGTVIILALICLLDWLVRSRRVSAFSAPARFLRQTVAPLLRPVERSVLRAGGLPSSAPVWALAIAIIGGIILISVLEALLGQIFHGIALASNGAAGIFVLLVRWTFMILKIALIVRVICSWLPISPFSPWVRWAYALSEPILRPLRQIVPTLGPIDITPIVAYFLLSILEWAILR